MNLVILQETMAICQLPPEAGLPAWAVEGPFFSITRTPDELSIVCHQANVPDGVTSNRDWRAIKVAGPLDFSLTGILAALAVPLAKAGISIFAISTFDTDYLLVKIDQLENATAVLRAAGHQI